MGVFKKLKDMIAGGNTLYYPGCLTSVMLEEIKVNYEILLKRIGIDFITLPDSILCCGSPVINAGYQKDFNDLKDKNLKLFSEYGITRIISNCPSCFSVYKNDYQLRSEHAVTVFLKHFKRLTEQHYDEEICYHDPCHLGRKNQLYEEPRELLIRLGFRVVEMRHSREKSLCCGGGGGLTTNYPDIALQAAKKRLKECTTKKLITTCPMCYSQFKAASADTDIEVLEVSEVLV